MTNQLWQPITREIVFDEADEQAHALLLAGGQNITFSLKGKVGSISFVDNGSSRLRVCEAVEVVAIPVEVRLAARLVCAALERRMGPQPEIDTLRAWLAVSEADDAKLPD